MLTEEEEKARIIAIRELEADRIAHIEKYKKINEEKKKVKVITTKGDDLTETKKTDVHYEWNNSKYSEKVKKLVRDHDKLCLLIMNSQEDVKKSICENKLCTACEFELKDYLLTCNKLVSKISKNFDDDMNLMRKHDRDKMIKNMNKSVKQ